MRLIDADALKEKINELIPRWNKITDYGMGRINSYEFVIKIIDNAPTADARPQGEWINHRNDNGHNIADCSECGKTTQWHDEDEDGIPRYCWYCGASMKGGAE